jgi:von Willebrand factor type A domain
MKSLTRVFRLRKQLGQSAIVLELMIAGALFGFGMLSVELSNFYLAREQLKADVQIAALACETTFLSSTSSNSSVAATTALNVFRQNSILGKLLANASLAPSLAQLQQSRLDPGEAAICVDFLDPLTHQPLGSSANLVGSVIRVTGGYSYSFAFLQNLHIPLSTFWIQSASTSAMNPVDVVMVMDVSGGMDDQTPVTALQRYWNYDNSYPPYHPVYMIPTHGGNPGQPAQGPLGGLTCYQTPNINGLPPQNLEQGFQTGTTTCRLNFSELPGVPTNQLRSAGTTDSGNPPGNYVGAYVGNSNSTPSGSTPPSDVWGQAISNAVYTFIQDYGTVPSLPPGTDGCGWSAPGTIEFDFYNVTFPNTSHSDYFPPPGPGNMTTSDEIYLTDILTNAEIYGNYSPAQIIGAIDEGNAAAQAALGKNIYLLASERAPDASFTSATSCVMLTFPSATPPGNLVVNPTSATPSYTRYGFTFGSGSAPSTTNEVLVPTGTPGPSVNNTPTIMWGPNYPNYFTDLVVNLDGNSTFNSFTYNGFAFPTTAALVEASRGNLESTSIATAAGLDINALGVTPQSGYRAAYEQAASAQIQPFSDVVNQVQTFLNKFSQSGDAHFGLVTFNDQVGSTGSASDNYAASTISPDYPIGGNMNVPLPTIPLSLTANNFTTIQTELPLLRVGGGLNVAQAINSALNQFDAQNSRPGTIRAIVLITSGVPNLSDSSGDPPNLASAAQQARQAAVAANQKGIPVYCVSIANDSTTQAAENAIYNDQNNDPTAGGIAAISGHGAQAYQIVWSNPTATQTQLNSVLANIARQLVAIVR